MINSEQGSAIVARTILEEKGEVRIQLCGNCMWPIVKKGDWLTIKKFRLNNLRFGDVAVGALSEKEFHVYAQFFPTSWNKKNGINEKNYLGKVTQIERNGRSIPLDPRSHLKKVIQILICPSNPYLLGAPKTLFQKIRSSSQDPL